MEEKSKLKEVANKFNKLKAKKKTYGGTVFNLPEEHKAGLRVPKGGSSCASCEYLGKDKKTCTNKFWIAWHDNNPKLPLPADEYCSDWWELDD